MGWKWWFECESLMHRDCFQVTSHWLFPCFSAVNAFSHLFNPFVYTKYINIVKSDKYEFEGWKLKKNWYFNTQHNAINPCQTCKW